MISPPLRLAVALLLTAGLLSSSLHARAGRVQLPGLPASGPFAEAVLFGFDDRAFPFRDNAEVRLFTGQKPRLVIPPGPLGSHDEALLYYGSVIRIGDTFHLWYNGNHGPLRPLSGFERENCVLAYATSKDGVNWTKPNLGLVAFNGSRNNNIVDLPEPTLWSTGAVVHDPEDPDPARRFKIAYTARYPDGLRLSVAFSPDGLRWTPSPRNPVGPFLEMAGIAKHQGLFYVNGQAGLTVHRPVPVRRLVTFVSSDFEHWSPAGAVGLDRGPDLRGPSADDRLHQNEEVHLGAALWNRGNVLVGIYGMWHGAATGDRGDTTIDLGLALTHDGIHFHEPIPDFRIIPAREQPGRPIGVAPALQQGQGMENVGDETLYWYSLWRGNQGSGVRLVTWPRDRLGALQPFKAAPARAVSCLLQTADGPVEAFVNVAGLGAHARLRIELLDQGFRPLPGYSGSDAAELSTDGLREPVRWPSGTRLPAEGTVFRFSVLIDGVRPEDVRLFAVYAAGAAP